MKQLWLYIMTVYIVTFEKKICVSIFFVHSRQCLGHIGISRTLVIIKLLPAPHSGLLLTG